MAQAILYHRYSTKRQDRGSSIERQDEKTRAICEQRGWEIVEVIQDRGQSAWKGDHLSVGELGKFRKRVDSGMVPRGTILVVENLDRLSRQDYRTARRWIEDITDRDIVVQVCSPELWLDRHAMSGANIGAMVQHLLESNRATAEATRKSEFQQRNIERMLGMIREGICPSPRVPQWLIATVGKPLTINEPRAALINLIYEWSASGLGYETICKKLNAAHTPWSSTAWTINYVRDILNSPAIEGKYVVRAGGERKPTGEVITGYYPRIVDADLVARARGGVKSRNRTGGANRSEAKNLFSGLVSCKSCGGTVGRVAGGDPALNHSYLICRQSRYGLCENTGGISYRMLEQVVLDNLLHLALDETHFASIDDIGPLVSQLAEAKSAVETLLTDQANLIRVLRKSPDSEALVDELEKIEGEISAARAAAATVEEQLSKARGQVSPEAHLSRVRELRASLTDDAEARRLVRQAIPNLISKIVVDRGTARIMSQHFCLIVAKNGDTSFYDFHHPRRGDEDHPDFARRRSNAIEDGTYLASGSQEWIEHDGKKILVQSGR